MTCERVVRLEGDVDLAVREAVADLLDEGVRQLGAGDVLVLDLSAVTFLDSTGLSCIITAGQATEAVGARLVVRGAPRPILRVLEITGLEQYLDAGG